jgi:hypothetical protein
MKKLSVRERTMIFILIIVAIAVVMGYFLLLPMMSEYKTIQTEYTELQDRELEMRRQIEQKESYQQAYNLALVQYNEYSQYFYRPLDPEILDELVTGLTLASGLSPVTMSMSQLSPEGVPLYTPTDLTLRPVPVQTPSAPAEAATGASASATGGEGESTGSDSGADGAASSTAEGSTDAGATIPVTDEPVYTEPIPPASAASYIYNVHMTADGSRTAFYDLLARIRTMDAIEVVRFDYTDPITIKAPEGSNVKDTFTPGRLNFDLKVYVFVEGVPASPGY